MFDDLIKAWLDLKEASRAMREGPVPTWPWDRISSDFTLNQRLRDATQGKGMRFAGVWREHAGRIRALTDTHRPTFERYHIADGRGETVDPTLYMQSMTIMPELIVLDEAGEMRLTPDMIAPEDETQGAKP